MKIPLFVMLTVCLEPWVAVARPGTLCGTVTDSTGAVMVGVSVEACRETSRSDCRRADTNQSGHYSFPAMLQGNYNVTISVPGFVDFVRKDVEIADQDVRYLNGTLEVAPLGGRDHDSDEPARNRILTLNRKEAGVLGPRRGLWEFHGSKGQVVRVAASSAEFDAEVELLSPTGELIVSDDDGGPGTDAWLVLPLPSTGRYQVRVTAADGGTGPYRLSARAVTSTRLETGRPVEAALGGDANPGLWEFEGAEGQLVTVVARSVALDLEVVLLSPAGDRLEWNDGISLGADGWLVKTLPATGRYQVWVRAESGGTGPYRLAVHALTSTQLEMCRPVEAVLGSDVHLRLWEFEGAEDQVVTVAARSAGFEPRIALVSLTGDRLDWNSVDTLGAGGWLVETLPATGRYQVWMGAEDGGRGPYQLEVCDVAKTNTYLEMGRPVEAVLGDDAPVGLWEFEGTEGQVVTVAARSAGFDPIVVLLHPYGDGFNWNSVINFGLEGRLVQALPDTGRYKVWVRAKDGGRGPYRLALRAATSSPLEMGRPVKGVLGSGGHSGLWEFEGAEGQIVSVSANSAAFHPLVALLSPGGEFLGWGVDGVPGTDAWLVETLPATGRYRVWVGAEDRGAGPYRLLAVTSTPLEMGRPVEGALGADAPVGFWEFEGAYRQVVSVSADSAAFDPEVTVYSSTGTGLQWGTGPRLVGTLPSTGRYRVRVQAEDGGTGPYRLAVHALTGTPIEMGRPVEAALAADAPVGLWKFDGAEGQVVGVAADSGAFDPRVSLFSPAAGRLNWGTGPRLVGTLPLAGRYQVLVDAEDGGTGPYRLAVHAPASPPIEMGRPVEAALAADAPVGLWEFEGAKGQLVGVAADSGAFNPEVSLFSPAAGSLRWGTGPRLVGTLPSTGRYQVLVEAEDSGTGSYRLAVETLTSMPCEMGKPVEGALAAEGQVVGGAEDSAAVDPEEKTTVKELVLEKSTQVEAVLGDGPVGVWTFTGAADQRVSVDVGSDAFTPAVEVWASGERVPWEETQPVGPDAGRATRLPAAGRYEVRVRAVDGGIGPYQVALRSGSAPNMPEPAPMAPRTAPTVGAAEIKTLAAGNRALAFDIYERLRTRTGNLVYSPYGLSLSMGMVAAGAAGDTARQIAGTFHFRQPPRVLHPAINALDSALTSGTGRGYRLDVANALWSQQGCPILPSYRLILGHHYGASPLEADFQGNPNGARRRINDWVSERTDNRIQDLLDKRDIGRNTRIVLTNAVAFEAGWQTTFEEGETEERPFHLRDGTRVETPTMRGDIRVGFAEQDGYKVIELPYKGGGAAMTVLLPDKGRFDWFERRLDAGMVAESVASLKETYLDLSMPKIEFTSSLDVMKTLSEMGMPDPFDRKRADFSGINGIACPLRGCLYVDTIAHKALVEVNEEGTKATAATAVTLIILISESGSLPRVKIDRPYIFLIRDVQRDTILFVARVLDPRVGRPSRSPIHASSNRPATARKRKGRQENRQGHAHAEQGGAQVAGRIQPQP